MNPKIPDFEGQGSLFTEEVTSHGTGEPLDAPITKKLQPVPEGTFEPQPSVQELDFSDPTITAAVHSAVVSDRRSAAQRGKHSPLQRDGNYLSVRAGDVLPGFGVVTHRNLTRAEEYAARLEAERRQR